MLAILLHRSFGAHLSIVRWNVSQMYCRILVMATQYVESLSITKFTMASYFRSSHYLNLWCWWQWCRQGNVRPYIRGHGFFPITCHKSQNQISLSQAVKNKLLDHYVGCPTYFVHNTQIPMTQWSHEYIIMRQWWGDDPCGLMTMWAYAWW